MNFWKTVFAVLVALVIFRACSNSAANTPKEEALDVDSLIYQSCVESLPNAISVEHGDPDKYTINLDEFTLCGDLLSEFSLNDSEAITRIFSSSEFTVILPDGSVVYSSLESTVTNEVYDLDGFSHLEVHETHVINGLTGWTKVEMPECGAPIVGVPGALTIFRCDPK